MSNNAYLDNLSEILAELSKAGAWLDRSFGKCRNLDDKGSLTEQQFDDLEAFTSRFARISDLLIQRVFRAIDAAEFEKSGTIIDSVNRAEKRGLVDDVSKIREIREVRNEISHEYASEQLVRLLGRALALTPVLQDIIKRTIEYCRKYE